MSASCSTKSRSTARGSGCRGSRPSSRPSSPRRSGGDQSAGGGGHAARHGGDGAGDDPSKDRPWHESPAGDQDAA